MKKCSGTGPALLAFQDEYLTERYISSGDGIRYLCRLLAPKIQHRTAWSCTLTVPQMVRVSLQFLASGMFLYSVGDAKNLNKGTICRTIRHVCLALKSLVHIFINFLGHRRFHHIKEEFYKIAGEFFGVLLGDKGYACEMFLLTPLADPQTLAQQAYNHGHASTRA
ncbi:hypothetical protein QQF64_006504 [Cirrhinus molitorella]|uniref:Nuclease HARBI1 n=1 Tax=Cirrhinus molitorella TaxID=172907 RepID=A0ABR3MBA1_9TELE